MRKKNTFMGEFVRRTPAKEKGFRTNVQNPLLLTKIYN